jgi:ATP-binding cassette, subfamily C, bacterial CydCD
VEWYASRVVRRIRELYRLLSRRAHIALALTAVLLIAERLILAAGAFGLTGRLAITWAASAAVVVLWTLRGLVRQSVVKETREKLTMLIAEAALERGGDGGFLPGEEADAAVFEGRNAAEQVLVRHLPPLVAEPIAAAILLIVVKPARVPVFAAIGAVAVAAVLLAALRRATVARQRSAWRNYMDVARDMLTSIRAAPELIASGHEKEYLIQLRASVSAWTESAERAERNAAVFQRIPFAAAAVVGVVFIVRTQSLDLTELVRLAVFFPPLAGLMRTVFELVRTAPRIQTLGPALDSCRGRQQIPPTTERRAPPEVPCEIRFEGVGFAYGDVPVLKDVSFLWRPSEVLGIKGPNGSGKSTLLKLMLGLLQPTEGRILVGGIDLQEIDLPAWRRRIAYLPQRPYLPEKATVIEAMRLTVPGLTEEEARRGLEEMGVWERLESRGIGTKRTQRDRDHPMQMQIATLSVGMRQRVMLARAFARGAAIRLFDEPDENLDAAMRQNLGLFHRGMREKGMGAVATHDEHLLGSTDAVVTLCEPKARPGPFRSG